MTVKVTDNQYGQLS